MSEWLQHPYFPLAMFVVCAVLAMLSLLSALNSGKAAGGLVIAILFAAGAWFFAPRAFALMNM